MEPDLTKSTMKRLKYIEGHISGVKKMVENDKSVNLGIGPSYRSWSKKSESLKSNKGYGKDVEVRRKKLSFQPTSSTPFFDIGYSF